MNTGLWAIVKQHFIRHSLGAHCMFMGSAAESVPMQFRDLIQVKYGVSISVEERSHPYCFDAVRRTAFVTCLAPAINNFHTIESAPFSYDYIWLEEAEWPMTQSELRKLLDIVKSDGWVCFRRNGSSRVAICALEHLLESNPSVGTIRKTMNLLFVKKEVASSFNQVRLSQILHRSQYDPVFRFNLLNSETYSVTDRESIRFIEDPAIPELGCELSINEKICRLPPALWINSYSRTTLLAMLKHNES